MREFKIYPSNLRRHKKDTNNRTKFPYVRVNLIFQPSLAPGKPRIELNIHWESFVCIVAIFSSRKLHHKVKPAGPTTIIILLGSYQKLKYLFLSIALNCKALAVNY